MKTGKVLHSATLGFPIRNKHEVLLGRKKRNIGAGLISGFGGGQEIHQTYDECMFEELTPESGLVVVPGKMENVAVLYAHNTQEDGSTFVCRIIIYLIYEWTGEVLSDTEEMGDNQWYDFDNLPLSKMMPDAPGWLPLILAGERLIIYARLGPGQKELLCPVEIKDADDLPDDWPHFEA